MTAWALKIAVVALLLLQGAVPGDKLAKPQAPEGTAPQCDNLIKTPAAHRCACGRAMQKCKVPGDEPADVRMDKKCLTYCREQKCFCSGPGCGG